ncbi:MAG TPA: hypothetical protein VGM73_13280 [Candidatus Didemnitutus sp.]|jgi:hypothetical protein
MRFRLLLAFVAGGVGSLLSAAGGPPWPERKTFQFGEFIIEASAEDEAYVEALAVQLADRPPAPAPAPGPAGKLTLDDLAKHRDHFLALISARIGLDAPTPKMAQVFDQTLALWRFLPKALPTELPHRFALWRKPDLEARLRAGQKIEGFTLDAAGLSFSFQINLTQASQDPAEAGAAMNEAWGRLVCPIKIGAVEGRSPADDVRSSLGSSMLSWQESFRAVVAGMERTSVFNVLHETTESGVVWHYLTSADRRWFCDGIANYVAWRVIQQEVGADEARSYYDLAAELQKYAGMAGKIDLAAWPAVENSGKYPEDLNTADYAFATKVIADVCARHGDDLLPKWFAQLGRTPREKATMVTVFKAYRRVAGDDLHGYIPKPAKS